MKIDTFRIFHPTGKCPFEFMQVLSAPTIVVDQAGRRHDFPAGTTVDGMTTFAWPSDLAWEITTVTMTSPDVTTAPKV